MAKRSHESSQSPEPGRLLSEKIPQYSDICDEGHMLTQSEKEDMLVSISRRAQQATQDCIRYARDNNLTSELLLLELWDEVCDTGKELQIARRGSDSREFQGAERAKSEYKGDGYPSVVEYIDHDSYRDSKSENATHHQSTGIFSNGFSGIHRGIPIVDPAYEEEGYLTVIPGRTDGGTAHRNVRPEMAHCYGIIVPDGMEVPLDTVKGIEPLHMPGSMAEGYTVLDFRQRKEVSKVRALSGAMNQEVAYRIKEVAKRPDKQREAEAAGVPFFDARGNRVIIQDRPTGEASLSPKPSASEKSASDAASRTPEPDPIPGKSDLTSAIDEMGMDSEILGQGLAEKPTADLGGHSCNFAGPSEPHEQGGGTPGEVPSGDAGAEYLDDDEEGFQ